jgi:asparagine synthase (glutamine-hydrolysing)
VDIKTWLTDDILTKVDRASMACSLEARVPYLAPDLAEFLMRLPPKMKLNGLNRKYILKRAAQNDLPAKIINRKKRGFNAPVSIWMKSSLKKDIDDLFQHNKSDILDLRNPVLQNIWREHFAGFVDHGYKLWALLSLILWETRVLKK